MSCLPSNPPLYLPYLTLFFHTQINPSWLKIQRKLEFAFFFFYFSHWSRSLSPPPIKSSMPLITFRRQNLKLSKSRMTRVPTRIQWGRWRWRRRNSTREHFPPCSQRGACLLLGHRTATMLTRIRSPSFATSAIECTVHIYSLFQIVFQIILINCD